MEASLAAALRVFRAAGEAVVGGESSGCVRSRMEARHAKIFGLGVAMVGEVTRHQPVCFDRQMLRSVSTFAA